MENRFAWLDKLSDGLEYLLKILMILSVALMAIVLLIGVLSRYVLPSPIVGTDELAMFLLVWVTFIGASIGIKNNDMVAVTIIVDRLARFKKVILILVQILVLAFSITFLIYGYNWVFSDSMLNKSSPALQIPLWIVYTIFPFTMLTTIIFSIRNIVQLLLERSH